MWPVHPDPINGEALSSWLRRIGSVYGCSVADLLRYGLGFPEAKTRGLDFEPAGDLVLAIAEKTGKSVRIIERTTFAGTLPFMSGRVYTDPVRADVESCSVLFEPQNPAPGSLVELRQWFRKETMSKVMGCRYCLADYGNGGILLGWGLKVVLSCPTHGVMLEPGRKERERVNWLKAAAEAAPELVSKLDRRSLEAVSEGSVQLPGGLVSAAQWFRIVQAIFHELNAPLFSVGKERFGWQLRLWQAADYHPHGPFETFKFDMTYALLIAMAIDQIEQGAIKPTGKYGKLFCAGGKRPALYFLRVR